MSAFFQPENTRFAVIFTVVLYLTGIYIFMLPAYFERLKHPRTAAQPRHGLTRSPRLYTAIYFLSPLIILFVLIGIVAWGLLSIFAVVMLMVMSPFHWLFSMLPFDPHFSLLKPWKRLSGRMFEYSRKLFLLLTGEKSMREMEPLRDQPEKK